MNLKIEATKGEIEEIAVMTYLSNHIVSSSGEFSDGYKYQNKDILHSVTRKLNKEILSKLPESKFVEADENSDSIFTHTIEMERHCQKILNQFYDEGILARICNEISKRDYFELYGDDDFLVLDYNIKFSAIYENNMKELNEFGLKRFRKIE